MSHGGGHKHSASDAEIREKMAHTHPDVATQRWRVEKLIELSGVVPGYIVKVMLEERDDAADEITRLRAENERLRERVEELEANWECEGRTPEELAEADRALIDQEEDANG